MQTVSKQLLAVEYRLSSAWYPKTKQLTGYLAFWRSLYPSLQCSSTWDVHSFLLNDRAQVDTEVMDPLMEWMEAYNVLTVRGGTASWPVPSQVAHIHTLFALRGLPWYMSIVLLRKNRSSNQGSASLLMHLRNYRARRPVRFPCSYLLLLQIKFPHSLQGHRCTRWFLTLIAFYASWAASSKAYLQKGGTGRNS